MSTKHPRLVPFTSTSLRTIDVLALPIKAGASKLSLEGGGAVREFLKRSVDEDLNSLIAIHQLTGKAGEILEVPIVPTVPIKGKSRLSIFLVGVGANSPSDLVKAGSAIGRKLRGTSKSCASLCGGKGELTRVHAIAMALSAYQWKFSSTNEIKGAPTFSAIREFDFGTAHAMLEGTLFARDLIHTPSNMKSPQWMAAQSKRALAKFPVRIVLHQGVKALAKFGGLNAVGNSSPKRPPAMIEIRYNERKQRLPHIVLVGKGIMFDTGGVSLKRPYENMVAMKSDMAGAAAILGAIRACAELGIECRITGLLMCAENLLSATAQRPSDVITHYDGQTVEVIDTDAEGRLVLADGLGYAVAQLNPDYLVDMATLTGAATLGLSRHYGAMYTRDLALAKRFARAGATTGEKVWHMPLVDEYAPSLRSNVADFKNIAEKPSMGGGSITAALFLEKFVGDSRWVHFDIAGVGRSETDSGENPKGGTGFGVRLLTEWMMSI